MVFTFFVNLQSMCNDIFIYFIIFFFLTEK